MNGLQAIAAAATVVTGVVAIIRRFVNGPNDDRFSAKVWPVLAIGVGVGFALGWQVNFAPVLVANVPALVAASSRLSGTAGQVISGIVGGLAAGFLHDAFSLIRSKTA